MHSTFAWFKATSAAAQKGSALATGSLTVTDNSAAAGNVFVNVTWGTAPTNAVYFTNSTQKTYYYAGTVDADHLVGPIDVADEHAFATYPYSVSLSTVSGGDTLPSKADLTAVKGVYTITFEATGTVKISTTSGADAVAQSAAGTATATVEITDDLTTYANGIKSGASGNVYYGFEGAAGEQTTSSNGTITIKTIAK